MLHEKLSLRLLPLRREDLLALDRVDDRENYDGSIKGDE
jgi:hypothetical protein